MATVTLTQQRSSSAAAATQKSLSSTSLHPTPIPIPTIPSTTLTPTHIKIDSDWYDLTAWKKTHPGGPLILEQMHGNDATDAFYSIHSQEAIDRLKRLPHTKNLPAVLADRPPPAPTQASINFRAFRAQLQKEGWFKRSAGWELFYAASVFVMAMVGSYLCYTGHPVWATIVLAFCMQQAGWIGHDHVHGRGGWCDWIQFLISGPVNGFSRQWWSEKHNTHHVFTNYIGVDADIENDPVFHLFFPDPKDDTIFRKMQHWYFVPVASLLYISWRTQSIQFAIRHNNYKELAMIAISYLWLSTLGFWVALGSIYFGGMLVAVIVTATHQSEEMIDPLAPKSSSAQVAPAPLDGVALAPLPETYSFCEGQFATTRDARTSDPFTEWLWGGMQYQLEHHLFPTMPKYRYSTLAPRVQKFAESNGLSYRCEGQVDILTRNFLTLKHFSAEKPTKSE
jgi:fatty acid desaturase